MLSLKFYTMSKGRGDTNKWSGDTNSAYKFSCVLKEIKKSQKSLVKQVSVAAFLLGHYCQYLKKGWTMTTCSSKSNVLSHVFFTYLLFSPANFWNISCMEINNNNKKVNFALWKFPCENYLSQWRYIFRGTKTSPLAKTACSLKC